MVKHEVATGVSCLLMLGVLPAASGQPIDRNDRVMAVHTVAARDGQGSLGIGDRTSPSPGTADTRSTITASILITGSRPACCTASPTSGHTAPRD